MIVPKKDVDLPKQEFKKFKKLSLELYQKQYNIYENEIILVPRPKKTNKRMIETINNKIADEKKPVKEVKGIGIKVETMDAELGFGQILNRFDYNYNQTVNLPINERVTFHLNANMQSKSTLGLYTVNPSISYQVRNTYYRVKLMISCLNN